MANINSFYGKVQALFAVSLNVNSQEIVTIIGSNGAGKSTLLKTISGLIHPQQGDVLWQNRPINFDPPHKIARMGIALVPEGRQVLASLTVKDNLVLGAYCRIRQDGRESIEKDLLFIYSIFPILRERGRGLAGHLSGGEQQMLAIGRALMSRPKLVLLDEPSQGLAPLVLREIFETILKLNRDGMTILLVEQNSKLALQIANRGYILENGRVTISSDAKELLKNDHIKKAYLG